VTDVALKVIIADLEGEPERAGARFSREAQLTSRLQHPQHRHRLRDGLKPTDASIS